MKPDATDLDRAVEALLGESRGAEAEPTVAELLSYAARELDEGQHERIREYLSRNPEAARFVLDALEFPRLEPPPGEAPVSEEEMRAGWQRLERRLEAESAPAAVVALTPSRAEPPADAAYSWPARWAWGLAAASLLVAVGAAAWGWFAVRERRQLAAQVRELESAIERERQPVANPPYVFLRGVQRQGAMPGPGGQVELGPGEELTVALAAPVDDPAAKFELDVYSVGRPGKPVWTLPGLRYDDSGRLSFAVHEHLLSPGVYKLRVYVLEAGQRRPVGDYELEVLAPQPPS